jgi:DNA-binding CsgD family transcriptional regulator
MLGYRLVSCGVIMTVSPQVAQAFDQCVDAVIGLSDWQVSLQRLGEALGAESSVLLSCAQDSTTHHRQQIDSVEHAGFSDLWRARLADPLSDPHSTRPCHFSVERFPCLTEHHITSDDERSRLLYFNEVARPGEREWWALLRARTDQNTWCLNLYRGKAAGPFEPGAAGLTSEAAPLLRRLTATAESFARTGWDARLHSFDQLSIAAFLVDRKLRLQRMNPAAESLLDQGIDMHRGRLCFANPTAQAAFSRFMRRIAAGVELSWQVIIPDEDKRFWLVEFIPVCGLAAEVFSGAKGLIVVSDMSGPRAMRSGVLQEAFGLTRAEERLAMAVADGQGLAPAASRLGIGYETARSHLRAVFDKTGTRSQAQLCALLTRASERIPARPPNG